MIPATTSEANGNEADPPRSQAAHKLTWFVASSHGSMIKFYLVWLICGFIESFFTPARGQASSAGADMILGLLSLVRFVSWVGLVFHAWRVASALGCAPLVFVLAIFMLAPFMFGLIGMIILAISSMAWLESRGVKCPPMGPDPATLARLAQQSREV